MGTGLAAKFDVLILTINDKGYRLARNLALAGFSVGWIDITDETDMQSRDLAGPFCATVPPAASDLDRREFLQDHHLQPIPQGFSLWHEKGILECSGALSEYQLNLLDQPAAVSALNEYARSGDPGAFQLAKDAVFSQAWLLFVAGFFNKTQMEMSFSQLKKASDMFSLLSPTYLPMQNYSLRRQRQQDLEVFGVQRLKFSDLSFRFEDDSFHFHSESHGMLRAKHFCNFLSAEDLHQLDPTFYQQVFSGVPDEAPWSWQRFDVELTTGQQLSPVAPWLLFINSWDLSWLEENFFVLRKEGEESEWSLWARVDNRQFAQVPYRDYLVGKLRDKLREKFLSQDIQVEPLRSARPAKGKVSILHYPIYQTKKTKVETRRENFYHCGPDQLGSMDLFAQHFEQKKLQQKIVSGVEE